ncbi:MAG: transaldolase family protein, partial [Elusimicrobiales bacterium]|nr:transaldolase family protein [Elusimicrobiales bacterium]
MSRENPLKKVRALGQAPWLDYIRRDLLDGGGLRRLIEEDGLCGVTSNPAIFEKAIAGSDLYDEDVRRLWDEGRNARDICDELTLRDVTRAADEFRPLWDRTDGVDGCVSLEVNPHLARRTEATVEEARRLWKAASRPNILIKVPATREGLPAIRQLISEGINVNVTLLFGLRRYRETAEAYLAGLAERAARGESLKVASVASFFLSRIDVMVDKMLEEK